MRFDHEQPIYLQIKKEICRRIARGDLVPGDKMLSLRDMALELQVNPNTVQRAYHELEAEGLLFTRRGQGTFVVEDEEKIIRLRERLARKSAQAFLAEADSLGLKKDDVLQLLGEVIQEEGF
jgi:GntR family transcriptional regulator